MCITGASFPFKHSPISQSKHPLHMRVKKSSHEYKNAKMKLTNGAVCWFTRVPGEDLNAVRQVHASVMDHNYHCLPIIVDK
jgi:hypothetical protein